MHFTSNLAKKKKMDAAWDEGFEDNTPGSESKLAGELRTFKGYFKDMKEGDRVVLTVVPGTGTEVVLNDQVKGTIEGDDFGTALLRVWLGPEPPGEDLKMGLLGKAD